MAGMRNPPLQSSDVERNCGEVVVELVPGAIEPPDGRLRQLLRVQRGVRERHHLIVAVVIQGHRYLLSKLIRRLNCAFAPCYPTEHEKCV